MVTTTMTESWWLWVEAGKNQTHPAGANQTHPFVVLAAGGEEVTKATMVSCLRMVMMSGCGEVVIDVVGIEVRGGEGGCSNDGGDGCDDGVGMKVVCRLWWRRKWPESGRKYGRRRKIFREGGEVCVGG
ncbi:hypothetical protein Tco_0673658 [Tanacetum coccineum]